MIITNNELSKKDYEQIIDIWLEVNIEAHSFIDEKYWLNNLDYVKNSIEKSKVFAYKTDNQIQGFIGVTGNYIEGLFIKKKYRRHGYGKRLLEYLKKSHESLSLSVYKKNEKAVTFYLSNGFLFSSETIEQETGEANISMIWNK